MSLVERLRGLLGPHLRDFLGADARAGAELRRFLGSEELVDRALVAARIFSQHDEPAGGRRDGEAGRRRFAHALSLARLDPAVEAHVFGGALLEALSRAGGDPVLADVLLPEVIRERALVPYTQGADGWRADTRLQLGRALASVATDAGMVITSAPGSEFVRFLGAVLRCTGCANHDPRRLARDLLTNGAKPN